MVKSAGLSEFCYRSTGLVSWGEEYAGGGDNLKIEIWIKFCIQFFFYLHLSCPTIVHETRY